MVFQWYYFKYIEEVMELSEGFPLAIEPDDELMMHFAREMQKVTMLDMMILECVEKWQSANAMIDEYVKSIDEVYDRRIGE